MTPRDDGARIDEDVIDAIGALGNRTRLEILLALAEAERDRQEQWLRMSFTELYDAVDVSSTSQFSYHLDRLVGPFLAETDGGYRLTYGGDKIVRTLLAGFYENTRRFDDTDVDGVCVFCGSESLVATVDRERFVVRCDACESRLLTDLLPRSQTRHRSAEEVVDSVGARIWGSVTLIRDGVCPECYGVVETTVESHPRDDRTLYSLESTCRECWLAIHVPLEAIVAHHPAGTAFFREHDVFVFERPLWEFFECIAAETVTIDVATVDPFSAAVEITLDGETRRFEIDDELTVTPVS
ncbi:winged helix-turn-helix domain-containing protein [Natronococcus sp. A-GB7]|uniref:ArsR/SmtB family transcription factor n=1 Tax=Natronococcus sp. A-GB7 TaxID=3037649 RepID=UPI00241E763F|nr:winged helix-turn-helix domain-containing protein [Natronococcus sp. A-GB7]MDG5818319.1 winged helix-turn-helix domain-containing protein [Natronococcus sp. A-GB7]